MKSGGHLCPSCDRFIGPQACCPYCDADSCGGLSLKTLRYASLVLAVLGLGLLLIMSKKKDIPVVAVDRITPMMNFAYMRVTGTVVRAAYVARKKGGGVDYLSFPIDDGTGEIRVAAYRDTARFVYEHNRLPLPGSRVDVAGSLRVSAEGSPRLLLQVTDHLKSGGGPSPR